MNASVRPAPFSDNVDAEHHAIYQRVSADLTEQWTVSAADRPHLYRIVHCIVGQNDDLDTVVDDDNLQSKLQKWRREGFVRSDIAGDDALDPALAYRQAPFMRDLRAASSALSATSGAGVTSADAARLAENSVLIGDVLMPRGAGGPWVPARNPAYLFTDQTRDVAHDIVENRRVMLIGHTGSGKTSFIEQAAALSDHGVLRANMNGQTTIGDFVGFWTVKGGETVWVDGVLPAAMREGLWLIIDEIDFAEPAILAVLTAVLEPRGRLLLKEKGNESIAPHPAFRLFATANAVGAMSRFRHLYQGANLMNEAFLDRWRVYLVDYLDADAEAAVLQRTFGDSVTPGMAHTLAAIAADCRAAFIREDLTSAFSTRRLLDWTALMLRSGDPESAAMPAIYAKVSDDDAALIRDIIRHHIARDPA